MGTRPVLAFPQSTPVMSVVSVMLAAARLHAVPRAPVSNVRTDEFVKRGKHTIHYGKRGGRMGTRSACSHPKNWWCAIAFHTAGFVHSLSQRQLCYYIYGQVHQQGCPVIAQRNVAGLSYCALARHVPKHIHYILNMNTGLLRTATPAA